MLKQLVQLSLLAGIVFGLASCKKDEAAVDNSPSSGSVAATTGDANGSTSTTPASGIDRVVGEWEMVLSDADMEEAKKEGGTPSGVLTMNSDGKFSLVMKSGDRKFEASGTTKIEGNKVLLTAELLDGKAPETEADKKPQELEISEDGSTLTASDGSKTTFKRKDQ